MQIAQIGIFYWSLPLLLLIYIWVTVILLEKETVEPFFFFHFLFKKKGFTPLLRHWKEIYLSMKLLNNGQSRKLFIIYRQYWRRYFYICFYYLWVVEIDYITFLTRRRNFPESNINLLKIKTVEYNRINYLIIQKAFGFFFLVF